MNKNLALLVLSLLLGSPRQGHTQAVASDPPKDALGRYFSKPVDFWKTGRSLASTPRPVGTSESAPEKVAVRENVWAQPIRTPDGSWLIYVPPRQVLDFLESPTEETARAYLAWKAEQTAKLRDAMVLLAKMKPANGEPLDASSGKTTITPASPDMSFRITYFKKPSCPHCVSQDAILSEWLARRTLGTLDVVLPGERPELWKTYQVRGTPTLVLEAGSQGRKELLVGLQSEAALESTLAKFGPIVAPESYTRKEPPR